jgi:hypothetical protein
LVHLRQGFAKHLGELADGFEESGLESFEPRRLERLSDERIREFHAQRLDFALQTAKTAARTLDQRGELRALLGRRPEATQSAPECQLVTAAAMMQQRRYPRDNQYSSNTYTEHLELPSDATDRPDPSVVATS